MQTETKTETYEEYVARRERELFDERLKKDKSNLETNRARLYARNARFGINRPLPRTTEELAIVAEEERNVLGVDVSQDTRNNALVNDDSVKSEELNTSIDAGKQPENDGIDAVIGSFTPLANDVVESLGVDVAIPFADDDKPSSIPEQAIIEVWLKIADTVGGIATSEILNALGLPIERTNEMEVCHIMTNLGYTKARKAVRGLPRQTVWLKD